MHFLIHLGFKSIVFCGMDGLAYYVPRILRERPHTLVAQAALPLSVARREPPSSPRMHCALQYRFHALGSRVIFARAFAYRRRGDAREGPRARGRKSHGAPRVDSGDGGPGDGAGAADSAADPAVQSTDSVSAIAAAVVLRPPATGSRSAENSPSSSKSSRTASEIILREHYILSSEVLTMVAFNCWIRHGYARCCENFTVCSRA